MIDAEVTTAEGASFAAVTRDVSRGGVCLLVADKLQFGTQIRVALQLMLAENAFSEPLILPGTVVWCSPQDEAYQLGVKLRELDDDTQEYLHMFLKFLSEGVQLSEDEHDDDDDDDDGGLFG